MTLAGICCAVPRPAPVRVQEGRAWSRVMLLAEVPVLDLWLVTLAGICGAVPGPAAVCVQEGRIWLRVMLLAEVPTGSLASNAAGRNSHFSGSSGSHATRAGTAFKTDVSDERKLKDVALDCLALPMEQVPANKDMCNVVRASQKHSCTFNNSNPYCTTPKG